MSADMTTATPEIFFRVYRLPTKLTDGFCFGGGKPIEFLNVDWFNAPHDFTPSREHLEAEIKRKTYYDPTARFLVLDTRPGETFVIEPMTEEVERIKAAVAKDREALIREMTTLEPYRSKTLGGEA